MQGASIEVELKVPIQSIDAMASAILARGGTFQCQLVHDDHYFDKPDGSPSFATTDEALRVRMSKDLTNTIEKHFITYKGGKLDSTTKTREEIDLAVADGTKALAVFQALGFQEVLTVQKRRKLYQLEGISIMLDEVDHLDTPYMELELLGRDDVEGARQALFTLLESLGMSRDASERRSYLELVLERLGARRE